MNTQILTKEERLKLYLKDHKDYRKELKKVIKEKKIRIKKIELKKLKPIKSRYLMMAELKRKGWTGHKIGNRYGISHQAVRDLLRRHFPNEIFPNQRYTPRSARVKAKCLDCGKEKIIPLYEFREIYFCNVICGNNFRKEKTKSMLAASPSNRYATQKQIRLYYLKCHKKYYDKHRNDPAYRAKIKEYNRRQSLKRKKKI